MKKARQVQLRINRKYQHVLNLKASKKLQTRSNNLNKILAEIDKLKYKTHKLCQINNLILNVLEILLHLLGIKRKRLNGLDSIFKSISVNLDASDGKFYDNLIKALLENQYNKLFNSIKAQYSCFFFS